MVWLVIGGSIPVATFSKHNGLQAISGFLLVSLLLIYKLMNIFLPTERDAHTTYRTGVTELHGGNAQ
jgi:hypothetical protein